MGRQRKEFLDILKAIGLVFGAPILAFFLLILPFISHIFTLCPEAIFGNENTLGARIYLNGEFAGIMEKYSYKRYQKQYTDIRLCTRIKDGDRLRAEKEGYEKYTAILNTSFNDSDAPMRRAWINLMPLMHEEKAKAR